MNNKAALAELAAILDNEPDEEYRVAFRCWFTKNPCGTDTWMEGRPCTCNSCRTWMRLVAVFDKHGIETPWSKRGAQIGTQGYVTAYMDEIAVGIAATRRAEDER